MREMKNSGIEWIDEIPATWELKRIKALFLERKEKNDPVKTDFILSLGAAYGVVPYTEKEGGGNKAKEDLADYRLAYPGDIVMNSMNIISGSVGMSKYFGCVSPVYYMLYPRLNNVDPVFYCYMFQTKAFQRSLLGLGNGILMKETSSGNFNTVRMRISMEKLGVQLLPFPSLAEQKQISDMLDRTCAEIGVVITTTKKTIEEYKKLKQSIITDAVTKGVRSDRVMRDTGIEWIGKIPIEWRVKKLRYLGRCQNGISKSSEFFGEGYPFVSYGDVYRNYQLPETVSGLIMSTDSDRENYSVIRGDVLFTRTSETIEEVGFSSTCLKTIEHATFAGFVIRFRPNSSELLPEYSKYYFRSDMHRRFFVKEMNLVTRASLGQELLKKLPIILPPLQEQLEIADYLEKKCGEIDSIIAKKEQYITELESYKNSLIYEYVTGKKEVPETWV